MAVSTQELEISMVLQESTYTLYTLIYSLFIHFYFSKNIWK